jgi:peroxiredoxin
MEFVLLITKLFLASILLIAGVAKASDPDGARKAFVGFGSSEAVAGQMSWLLPLLEIVTALTLIPPQTATIGAFSALILMVAFSIAIATNLIRGKAPDCNCFGQLQSEPISWTLFARNVVLAVLAVLIVVGGQRVSSTSFVGLEVQPSQIVGLIGIAFVLGLLLILLMHLRRFLTEQAKMLARLEAVERLVEDLEAGPIEHRDAFAPSEGLPVGAPAPQFLLQTLTGDSVSRDDLLRRGKPVLLLFVSPSCGPCAAILQDVRTWQTEYADRLTIAVLSKGSTDENEKRVAQYVAGNLLLSKDSGVVENYEAKWTPAAVLLGVDGKIASPNAFGDDAIRSLLTGAVASGNQASKNGTLHVKVGTSALKIGDPVPEFSLADVNGATFTAADLRGRETLLLFWSPTCPFCTKMSDEIQRWEQSPPINSPRLIFVVSGDYERVKTESARFESLFVHDEHFSLGAILGTSSTPSAVLIDAAGRIASSVAIGAPKVLLLGGVPSREVSSLPAL